MAIFSRLEDWKEQGVLSPEQSAQLAALSRGEPVSVFLEINVLLYAGVLAFVGGLGWTVTTWSDKLGALAILAGLCGLMLACFWYCFSRAPAWSRTESPSPNLVFDYVLYLGCLTWSVTLAYIEQHFHLLSGQWDDYLLVTAGVFFFLAYRFDNRFVLSLALTSLAGWFGLTISRWSAHQDAEYRQYAIVFSLVTGCAGALLRRAGLKVHFFGTYLNIAANVLFWALLSGVFEHEDNAFWYLALLVVCGASLTWGLKRRQFAFVVYAAVYGYIGLSSLIVRAAHDGTIVLAYFLFTGTAMLVGLVAIARRFGREA